MANKLMRALDMLSGAAGEEIEKNRQFEVDQSKRMQVLAEMSRQFEIQEKKFKLETDKFEHEKGQDLLAGDIAKTAQLAEAKAQLQEENREKIKLAVDAEKGMADSWEGGLEGKSLKPAVENLNLARQNLGLPAISTEMKFPEVPQKIVYDPFSRSVLQSRGRAKVKAEVDLTGVEAIASDVTDVLATFKDIPDSFRGVVAGRTVGAVGKFLQLDPSLKAYEDTKELTLANIAKKLGGEVGVLTDRDIERIKKALPERIDTEETASTKIKFVLNYIDRRIKAKQKVAEMTASGLGIDKTEWFDSNFNVRKLPQEKPKGLKEVFGDTTQAKIDTTQIKSAQSYIDKLKAEGKL